MKSFIKAVVIVASLAASATVFAQSHSHTTRAQVRAELEELQQAGYRVGDGDEAHYPEAIQAAEARVAARSALAANGGAAATSGYGGSAAGASQTGRPAVSAADWFAMYGH
ncbi:hypothetical protein P3T18_003287 [Paraburkholderia sp. GAS199]|uniref:DUF4148 domain-containing protein n=1 Tax=Paraburkholderia sp. GAS199 TaxID=3035126 RepID=UPI003D1F3558